LYCSTTRSRWAMSASTASSAMSSSGGGGASLAEEVEAEEGGLWPEPEPLAEEGRCASFSSLGRFIAGGSPAIAPATGGRTRVGRWERARAPAACVCSLSLGVRVGRNRKPGLWAFGLDTWVFQCFFFT
jgi:hypothetical protein